LCSESTVIDVNPISQDLRRFDEDFSFLMVQYTVDKVADPVTDPREAEAEHRKQEEVLKR
jgi:endoribonuclease Dicer